MQFPFKLILMLFYFNAIKIKLLTALSMAICITVISCHQTGKNAEGSSSVAFNIAEKDSILSNSMKNKVFFIYGKSIGEYQKFLFKAGKFDEMMRFTAKKSKIEFGYEAIKLKYQQMIDFGFEMRFINVVDNKDGSYTLDYETYINATKGVLRMKCVIENDTARLLINNNNLPNPFKF